MPERLYLFTDQGNIGPVDFPERAVVVRERIVLRPLDGFSGTRYDRNGTRKPAVVQLPEIVAEGISELYGFWAEIDGESNGSVTFQVSTDAGATWFRWDGAVWINDGLWSTREQIDAGLPSLPLPSPKRLLVRLNMQPGANGKSGPEVKAVSVFYELAYQWEEDLLRSLKHFLESQFAYAGVHVEDVTNAQQVTIEDNVIPSVPIAAFNLTADPRRLTNLASGVLGQVVSFTAPQTGSIEVLFRALPPVFITANVALEQSKSLALVLEITNLSENKGARTHAPKIDWHRSANEVRIRPQPVWDNVQIRIQAQSPIKREAEAMVESIQAALQYDVIFYSEATGEEFIVKGLSEITVGDVVSEGLYVRQAVLSVTGRHWLSVPFITSGLAQTVFLEATLVPRAERPETPNLGLGIEVDEFQIQGVPSSPQPGSSLLSGRLGFSYSTTSPASIFTLQPGDIIDEVAVVITEAFDDAMAVLELGTMATPDLVFGPSDLGLGAAPSQVESEAKIQVAANDSLVLTIQPGTSTRGRGYIVFTVRR